MRRTTALIPLVASSLFGTWSCSKPDEALNPSLDVTPSSCPLQVTAEPPVTITVAPNSTNNSASWYIKNNGSSAVTITSQTLPIAKPPITAIRKTTWITFPYSLAGGSLIDADLVFDVGAGGSGTLGGLTIGTSPCGSTVLPSRPVVVQGPAAAPTVATTPATNIGTTTATLNGSANPNGASTTSWFRYSTTNPGSCNDTFGTRSPSTGGTVLGSGTAAVAYSRALTGLTAAGTYYVCAIASNSLGTRFGTVGSFTLAGGGAGIPFGPYGIFAGSQSTQPYIESFNLGTDDIQAQYILERISSARAKNLKLMMQMTGGPHSAANPGHFLSVINGTLQFDMTKWTNYMNLYNTTAIKTAVSQAVADGVIIGNNVMDEPNVSGIGDGNTWGPKGTMTKARVDAMCAHVKSIFPTLPVGVAHTHEAFEPTKSYAVCDFIISQYSTRFGSVETFKQGALALGQRDHHAIAFSMNILNGGTQDNDGTWDCSGTGGKGTYSPNCRMTAAQVKQYGQTLGVAGCAMTMWKYDQTFMSNAANKQAFADVRSLLNTKPSKACRRA